MTGRSRTLALGAGLVAALTILFLFDPAAGRSFYPPCLFRTFFGMTCPGCGTLRALHQLLHGHVAAAWRLNPGVTALAPVLAAFFFVWIWRGRRTS